MCVCFATYYLAQNCAEFFLDFEHPTFQGAPFRALFVYQVRMLRHLLFDKNRAEIFLDFAPYLSGALLPLYRPWSS